MAKSTLSPPAPQAPASLAAARPEGATEILVRDGEHLKLRARTLRVEVLRGPNAGQVSELAGPEIRIGTGRGVQLVLFDPAVSRHHLTLRIERHGVRVIDAGSSNGTELDGVRVMDAYARPDSTLVLGSTALRLRVTQGTVDLPLSSRERFGGLLGRSVAMRQVFTLLERIAETDDSVLVEGETGTGKELVAEAIHEESHRANGPFVVFDCSAVSPNLIESELFGHVRGAFTGASATRAGLFDVADGGTLFLDEIGEMPLSMQTKLLRVLQNGEVRPVGGERSRTVDVRIIGATHRDLEAMVAAGTFREDLFYRLNVVGIRVPPLRERREDIPLLVSRFVDKYAEGRKVKVTRAAMDRLAVFPWPGNVRQLENEIRRALVLADDRIDAGELSEEVARGGPAAARDAGLGLKARVDALEAQLVRDALQKTSGNQTRAAEVLGVSRFGLQKMMRRLGIKLNA